MGSDAGRTTTRVLPFFPLLVGLVSYAAVLLATPIPNDSNSPVVFLSAIEGKVNLLSWIVRSMLSLQPSLIVYLLTSTSVIALYLALHLLLRMVGTALGIRLVSSVALLIFIAVNFVIFSGSLMLLMPTSLASLALALAITGRSRALVAAVALVLVASLVQPVSGLAVGVVGLSFLLLNLKRKFSEIRVRFIFPLAGLLGFLIGRDFVEPISSTQPIPGFFQFQQEPVFYLLLIGASSLGIYLLWKKDRVLSTTTVVWVGCSFFLAPDAIAALLFISVPVSLLASLPVNSGLVGIASWEATESVAEIDLQKVAAVSLVAAFLISSASLTFSTSSSFVTSGGSNYQSILNAASFLRGKDSTLVAPIGELPYLSTYSGNTPPNVDAQTLSAWGETTFRLQNGYVRVDDWEPFSASRAPRVAIYDGVQYEYLLYVDDSLVQFTLVSGTATLPVSPYGMAFLGYKWVNGSSLQTQFASNSLSIIKTEVIVGTKAVLSYQFQTHGNALVENSSMAVIADWPYVIGGFSGQDGVFFAQAGGKNFGFQASPGASANLLQDQHRIIVSKQFGSSTGTIVLQMEAFDAQPSGLPPMTATVYDYFRSPGNKYLVADSGAPDRFSNVPTSLQQSLYVDDSYQSFGYTIRQPIGFEISDAFTRVKFYTYTNNTAPLMSVVDSFVQANLTSGGRTYTEAPSQGTVLHESVNGANRTVGYETAGIYINKTLVVHQNTLSLAFQFKAKTGSLSGLQMTLWLPWGMKYSHTQIPGQIVLLAPMGTFTLNYDASLLSEIGPHSPGGQPSIKLWGSADRIGILLSSLQPLSVNYTATTRPAMSGSDTVQIGAPYLSGPWVESPSGATTQSRSANQIVATSKFLEYVKTYSATNEQMKISYRVVPIGNAIITGGYTYVWLNFAIDNMDHRLTSDGLIVGAYSLTASPQPVRSTLATSEFGTRVLNYSFSGTQIDLVLRGGLNATYLASSGPNLGDEVIATGVGDQYILDSPYKSSVIRDNASLNQRIVQYQTKGLDITKSISTSSNDSMTIRYSASCNQSICSSMRNASAYLWIPWSRYLVSYTVTGSFVNLTLDSGQLSLDFSPMPSFIAIVSAPQPSVVAHYSAVASVNLTYTITIGSKTNLSVTFQDSSRPVLTTSDVISINSGSGNLQLVFQTAAIRAYRVTQG